MCSIDKATNGMKHTQRSIHGQEYAIGCTCTTSYYGCDMAYRTMVNTNLFSLHVVVGTCDFIFSVIAFDQITLRYSSSLSS